LQAYNRATQLQPQCPYGEIGASNIRLLEGNFAAAREIFGKTGYRNQGDGNEADQMLAQIEFFARNFKDAEALYSDLAQSDPRGGGRFHGAITYRSALGRIKQELGESQGAKALLNDCFREEVSLVAHEPENPEAVYRLAAVEASLDQPKYALDHLRRAISLGWIDCRPLRLDPRFDSIRARPEYQAMISDLSAKVAKMRSVAQSEN
jgi:tetratricopeptide (TPR) repeat protein